MRFTKKEDQFLLDNYLTIPAKTMSRMLGRSESAARQRMYRIGAIPPPEVAARFKKQSQFKTSQRPFNKGKKMPPDVYEKVKETFFKKGNLPHNALPDLAEVVRKEKDKSYILIKLPGERKLVFKHVWVYSKSTAR